MPTMNLNALAAADWWGLFAHFLMLSLLSVGGAIATVPDMHRYLVSDKHWLSDETFSSSIALAQAAPGPNLLFVPVLGFQVAGLAGAAVTLIGMLLPSTTLTLMASRWMQQRREATGVRAFVAGMMPVTIGLLLATGWVLAQALERSTMLMALVAITALLSWRTKIAPVWMVMAGAVIGALGWL